MDPTDTARLLPWPGPDGKPCYVLGGDGAGYVSRLADRVEAEQMNSAAALLKESCRVLADRSWTPGEIHLLAVELNAHLVKVHRVSKSRGDRLLVLEGNTDEDGEDDESDASGAGTRGDDPRSRTTSPDRPSPEQGQPVSRPSRRARLTAPVRPAGSAPGAPLKDAAQGPPAR